MFEYKCDSTEELGFARKLYIKNNPSKYLNLEEEIQYEFKKEKTKKMLKIDEVKRLIKIMEGLI